MHLGAARCLGALAAISPPQIFCPFFVYPLLGIVFPCKIFSAGRPPMPTITVELDTTTFNKLVDCSVSFCTN
jgi:hypothetical protein